MPFVAPWLEPQNFIGASEAGARLGLSRAQMLEDAREKEAELALQRDELSARMAAANAERERQANQQAAEMALREAALKQQGLLGGYRVQNEENALTAREALDQARENSMNQKGVFANTAGGLFTRDPVTGEWTKVPGTEKPEQQYKTITAKYPAVTGTPGSPATPEIPAKPDKRLWGVIPIPFTGSAEVPGKAAVPAIPNQLARTVTERVPIDNETPTEAPAAAALQAPQPKGFIGTPGGQNLFSSGAGRPPATGGVATPDIIKQALKIAGGDKESARQWLQDNNYTIPPASTSTNE